MRRKVMPRHLRQDAINALTINPMIRNFPVRPVELALQKWEAGYFERPTPSIPCIHGPDSPLAIDCECAGCVERICFLFFDQCITRLAR